MTDYVCIWVIIRAELICYPCVFNSHWPQLILVSADWLVGRQHYQLDNSNMSVQKHQQVNKTTFSSISIVGNPDKPFFYLLVKVLWVVVNVQQCLKNKSIVFWLQYRPFLCACQKPNTLF